MILLVTRYLLRIAICRDSVPLYKIANALTGMQYIYITHMLHALFLCFILCSVFVSQIDAEKMLQNESFAPRIHEAHVASRRVGGRSRGHIITLTHSRKFVNNVTGRPLWAPGSLSQDCRRALARVSTSPFFMVP